MRQPSEATFISIMNGRSFKLNEGISKSQTLFNGTNKLHHFSQTFPDINRRRDLFLISLRNPPGNDYRSGFEFFGKTGQETVKTESIGN